MRTLLLAAALALSAVPLVADLAYVYVRAGENVHVSASNVEVSDLGRITRRHGGTFLWVELDDEELVIRDPDTLAEVERAFEPLRAIAPEMEALHERIRPLEQRAADLEQRLEQLEEQLDDDRDLSERERERLEERMRQLARELRAVERRIRDLEREERRLERVHEQREEEAERELEEIVERVMRQRGAR